MRLDSLLSFTALSSNSQCSLLLYTLTLNCANAKQTAGKQTSFDRLRTNPCLVQPLALGAITAPTLAAMLDGNGAVGHTLCCNAPANLKQVITMDGAQFGCSRCGMRHKWTLCPTPMQNPVKCDEQGGNSSRHDWHHCVACGLCGSEHVEHCENPRCDSCFVGNYYAGSDPPCAWCGIGSGGIVSQGTRSLWQWRDVIRLLAAAAEAPHEVVVVRQAKPKTIAEINAALSNMMPRARGGRGTRQAAPEPEIKAVDVNSAEVRQDLAALDELVESIRSTGL